MAEVENFTDRVGRAIRDVFRGRERDENREDRREDRRNERRNLAPRPPEERVPQSRFEEFTPDSGR
jgi:hypothetical protein